MNKFFVLILAIFITSIATSCTKENSVAPVKAKTTFVADKSELGVGD
ncbi:MAG: hypothetical protein ABIN91_10545 [Mucilaginibacter sp.]